MMLLIDHYAYNNKLASIHRGEKFAFFALTITIGLVLPSTITSLAIIILMAGAVVFLAGIPWRFYLKLMLLPGSFLMIGVILVAISISREVQDFLWAVKLGSYVVGISKQNLEHAINLFLRSLGAVSCLYFLSLTTPLTDIMAILKRLLVPTLVVELMVLIYRFIFTLLEVTLKIYTAQSSRLGYKNIRTSYASLSQLVLSLFVKSYQYSQTMYDSLASRCYAGKLHFVDEHLNWSAHNIFLIIIIDGALVVSSLYTGGYL